MKALGGGIAVQHRMAFQGEYFVDRYGKEAVKHTPPVAKMLALDVPVGLGTHATYDESISRMLDVFEKVNRDIPFNGLHWFFDHAETITERNS